MIRLSAVFLMILGGTGCVFSIGGDGAEDCWDCDHNDDDDCDTGWGEDGDDDDDSDDNDDDDDSDDNGNDDDDTDGSDDSDDDTDGTEAPPEPVFDLDPDSITAGDLLYGTLGGLNVDWTLVTAVTFADHVDVLDFETNDRGAEMVLKVDDDATAGLVAVTVTYDGAELDLDPVEILAVAPCGCE